MKHWQCMETKTCTGPCGRTLPLDAFAWRHRAKGYRGSHCRECKAAYAVGYNRRPNVRQQKRKHSQTYRGKNRTAVTAKQRRWNRSSRYGLVDSVALELRGMPCFICGAPSGSVAESVSHVDHDHRTGAVRGALCFACNHGIGKFKDSPELLQRAVWYLTRGADYRVVDRER